MIERCVPILYNETHSYIPLGPIKHTPLPRHLEKPRVRWVKQVHVTPSTHGHWRLNWRDTETRDYMPVLVRDERGLSSGPLSKNLALVKYETTWVNSMYPHHSEVSHPSESVRRVMQAKNLRVRNAMHVSSWWHIAYLVYVPDKHAVQVFVWLDFDMDAEGHRKFTQHTARAYDAQNEERPDVVSFIQHHTHVTVELHVPTERTHLAVRGTEFNVYKLILHIADTYPFGDLHGLA